MKVYAVWYYDAVIRGPFAKLSLAKKALATVKRDNSCAYEFLRVGQYDSEKDVQVPGWTHPSVLLLLRKP